MAGRQLFKSSTCLKKKKKAMEHAGVGAGYCGRVCVGALEELDRSVANFSVLKSGTSRYYYR